MNNSFGVSELCDRILYGMGANYSANDGAAVFSIDHDSWRVEVSTEPRGYILSFTEDFGIREAVITTIQFSELASLVGLKAVDVFIHQKGQV